MLTHDGFQALGKKKSVNCSVFKRFRELKPHNS